MPVVTRTAAGLPTEPSTLNFGTPVALAGTGTVITNAAAITGRFTIVSGADNAVGVQLPAIATPGEVYLVYSSVASNGLKIYPQVNSTINDGSANAAYAMEGKALHMFVAANATNWLSIGLANA